MHTPFPHPPTIAAIQQWVFANAQGPINAVPQMLNQVPQEKGIYFFFMHPDGYKILSRFITIHPLETLVLDNDGYHLVYLGTAGTGKKKLSHLFERLNWHLTQTHTNAAICSGTLSTLRAGLGALLCDDLILYPNSSTEQEVNDFFAKYCRIYWITYKDFKSIENDELHLIQLVKPLLNIKNNPNASAAAPNNPTRNYKTRRVVIYQNTRTRIGCNNQLDNSDKTERFQYQLTQNQDSNMEINFLQNQSIHEVLNGIEGLPKGKCSFIIRNANDANQLIYASSHRNGWRKTGVGQQNIYTYFNAPDTVKNNLPKWQVIQQEMQEKNINEAIIRIIVEAEDEIESSNQSLPTNPTSQKPIKATISTDSKEVDRYDKVLFLIPCCSKKIKGGGPLEVGNTYFDNPLTAGALIAARQAAIFANNPNLRIVDPNDLMHSWDRYDGRIYRKLKEHQQLMDLLIHHNIIDIAIVSAYYGVVNLNTPICNYSLKMGAPGITNHWRNPNTIAAAINSYCDAKKISFIQSFLRPDTYYRAAFGNGNILNRHMNHWPFGLAGANNVNNHVADAAIAQLYYIRRLHFGY